jgi:hypothetical protein
MALWGPGLFDNDTAPVVLEHWKKARAAGEEIAGAVQAVQDDLIDWADDDTRYADMVLTLAFIASAEGPIPAKLKKKAVKVIRTEVSLARWLNAPDLRVRRRVEQALLQILTGEMEHPGIDADLTKANVEY